MFEPFFKKYEAYAFFVWRVAIGFLFAQHGMQKVFGLLTERAAAQVGSLMWVVGTIEIVAGLLIAVGFLTRYASFAGLVIMIGAYFTAHLPRGGIPIMNGGELALLYLFSFLLLLFVGGRKWMLDAFLFGREV